MNQIGIAAASSPFDKASFEKGVAQIKKWGFEVFFREDIFSKERYLAGSDERRARELTELIENPKIKAVFFARGGYGSQRVLSLLDFDHLKKTPKPLIGFSDLTPLLNFLNQKCRFPALYGPVVTQLGNPLSDRTLEVLRWHLTQTKPHLPFDLHECAILKEGKADGGLAGGCLSLIASSLGTPYAADFKDKILFFEDTNEKTYRLDRMLTQLKNAGVFKQARGVLVGTLEPKEGDPHSVEEMLGDILGDFKGPVVTGFPAGHTDDFVSLPLGVKMTLDTQTKKLTFHECLY